MILYHDTETFCETPIRDGTWAYAERVEIMVHSYAIDDGPVAVWDATDGSDMPDELAAALASDCTIVGHNYGAFDRVMLKQHGIEIDPARINDTMIQAMSHGLPGSLDKLCAIFKVPADLAKHKEGKDLIRFFCMPKPKNMLLRRATRTTHPEKWQRFLDYAGSDISSMRWLYKNLPRWNYPAQTNRVREYDLWCLDQKINDRGFKVDLDLAHAAIETVRQAKAIADGATAEITDGRVRSATQRDKLLAELLLEYGVSLPDMTSSTLETRLADEDLPEAVRDLIAQRLMVSTTSTAKYNRIVKAVSSDGRLRGSLQFCGAPRTKRWSGKVFQPQNLPRPDMKQEDIDRGIDAMKAGVADLMFDDANRVAWNAIRGLIVAEEGRKLVQADLSGIESRVLPWLAGQTDKLEAWARYDAGTGPKVYNVTASGILNIDPYALTSDQVQAYGKVPDLALGYGGAIGAFKAMAKIYGIELEDDQIHEIVRAWRSKHSAIADWHTGLWALLDRAARLAIQNPGQVFEAGEHIAFERWRNWLKMHLPSGGFLSYADPRIVEDPRRAGKDSVSFMGINNYTRKWERIYTYGGKLSADCLSADTIVLTPSGWKSITDIQLSDQLWDGVEWVSHDGLVHKGRAETTLVDGVGMTPDHLVLTEQGWRSASQSKRHKRAAVALPDGYQLRRFGWKEVALERAMRLWGECRSSSDGVSQGQDQIVWLPARPCDFKAAHYTWNVFEPTLQDLERYARTLQSRHYPGLGQLWRTRHQGLFRMGSVVRGVLARYGRGLRVAFDARSPRQQRQLRAEQLSLGNPTRAGAEYAGQPNNRNAVGRDDSGRSVGTIKYQHNDTALPHRGGSVDAGDVRPAKCNEQVYDLVNAGPRHRLTILGDSGPMLVHNCTQATARELLAGNLQHVEDGGFPIILQVHDEVLTEPLDDDNQSVHKLIRLLTRRPEWIDDRLPLSAGGFEGPRYRKE